MAANPRRVRAATCAAFLALALATLSGVAGAELTGVVNVNTASATELQLLPGVGEVRAHAILEARERKGGFRSVEELVEVKGIGDAALERLRPFVTVKGKTTAKLE